MLGPFKVLRVLIKNRTALPNKEVRNMAILVVALGVLHIYIFFQTAGRIFPDSIIPRIILMTILVASVLLTVIYVRGLRWIKKYQMT